MKGWSMKAMRWVPVLAALLLVAGCSTRSVNQAPVEDRMPAAGQPASTATPGIVPQASPAASLPGAENAGKPGYYTVRPGDTLIRIGLDAGQSWRDIARWNNLENANRIEVGQVLRIIPPVTPVVMAAPVPGAAAGASAAPAAPASSPVAAAPAVPASGAATTRPVSSGTVAAAPVGPASGAVVTPAPAPAPAAAAAAPAADDMAWVWPARGAVLAGFDDVKNKGLDIAGSAGDPVVAAADGEVVYVGAGLRGYGNLVVLKHNNTYITAYAHNQTLLVKEDQRVRKGQKIAEMGSSDADRVKLHFELRRQGKPVDPARYLPAR